MRDTFRIAETTGLYCSVEPKSLLLGIAEILRRSEENVENDSFDFSKFKYSSERIINIIRKQYEEKGLIPLKEESIDESRALMYIHVSLELSDEEAETVTRDIFSKHYKFRDKINEKRKLLGMKPLGLEDIEKTEDDENIYEEDTIEGAETDKKKEELANQYGSFKNMFTETYRNINPNEIDFVKRNKSRILAISSISDFIEFSPDEALNKFQRKTLAVLFFLLKMS